MSDLDTGCITRWVLIEEITGESQVILRKLVAIQLFFYASQFVRCNVLPDPTTGNAAILPIFYVAEDNTGSDITEIGGLDLRTALELRAFLTREGYLSGMTDSHQMS